MAQYDKQFEQDTNTVVVQSVQVGKGTSSGHTKENTIHKRWSLDNDGQLNNRTTEARFRRLEDNMLQLEKENRVLRQQQPEQQQQTTLVAVMNTPAQSPTNTNATNVKDMMANVKNGTTGDNYGITKLSITASGVLRRPDKSPDSDDSPYNGDTGNNTYNVGRGNSNNPNGDDGGGGDGSHIHTIVRGGGGFEDRGREFSLAKSSSIIIQPFSWKSLNSNPYMPFNNSLKRLVYNQGADGEQLLDILEWEEKYGATKFDNNKLQVLAKEYPKALEYNRAATSLLLNFTTSIAKGMVEHGVETGSTPGGVYTTITYHLQKI